MAGQAVHLPALLSTGSSIQHRPGATQPQGAPFMRTHPHRGLTPRLVASFNKQKARYMAQGGRGKTRRGFVKKFGADPRGTEESLPGHKQGYGRVVHAISRKSP